MRFVLGLVALAWSAVALSQGAAYAEGEDYQELANPVPTSNPDKIEVAEVFAYTCPHCFNFEAPLKSWQKNQADDVVLVKVPAMWNNAMEVYARGFYTAKALGLLDEVHMPIFTALHQEGKQFGSADDWAAFLADYGADPEAVKKTYSSFGVSSQVRQADAKVRGYKITGTPELVVDGKYRISSRMTGSHSEMLKVASYLIEQIRAGEL